MIDDPFTCAEPEPAYIAWLVLSCFEAGWHAAGGSSSTALTSALATIGSSLYSWAAAEARERLEDDRPAALSALLRLGDALGVQLELG